MPPPALCPLSISEYDDGPSRSKAVLIVIRTGWGYIATSDVARTRTLIFADLLRLMVIPLSGLTSRLCQGRHLKQREDGIRRNIDSVLTCLSVSVPRDCDSARFLASYRFLGDRLRPYATWNLITPSLPRPRGVDYAASHAPCRPR